MAPRKPSTRQPLKKPTTTTAKPSSTKKKPTPSPTQLLLQKNLAITPKTAGLLLRAGYADYRSLRHASPNAVLARLKALPGMAAREAEWFRRPLRRMVWLGTQAEPEAMAARTAHCSYWTVKGLVAKGVWAEGYDDLTGEEVQRRFVERAVVV